MSDDEQPKKTEHVYLVTRVIQTAHNTAVSIPMGVFDDKEGAEMFQRRMGAEVKAIMEMQVVAPDGTMMDLMVGGVLAGMGITKVSHVRHGPVEITQGSGLIDTASQGRILLPTQRGRPN